MILKIKTESGWRLIDNIARIKYEYLVYREGFDEANLIELVENIEGSSVCKCNCKIRATGNVKHEEEFIVIFNKDGYLCNDEGKTLEKLVVAVVLGMDIGKDSFPPGIKGATLEAVLRDNNVMVTFLRPLDNKAVGASLFRAIGNKNDFNLIRSFDSIPDAPLTIEDCPVIKPGQDIYYRVTFQDVYSNELESIETIVVLDCKDKKPLVIICTGAKDTGSGIKEYRIYALRNEFPGKNEISDNDENFTRAVQIGVIDSLDRIISYRSKSNPKIREYDSKNEYRFNWRGFEHGYTYAFWILAVNGNNLIEQRRTDNFLTMFIV